MNNKFTLEQLDAYAKKLTNSQAALLYESKTHKKAPVLNESYKTIDNKKYLSVMVHTSDIINTGRTTNQFINTITENLNVEYKAESTTLTFYTKLPSVYKKTLAMIKENKIDESKMYGVPDRFQNK